MKFVLSDDSLNSYGFRVLTSGLDISQFQQNPIMYYNHDRTKMPVGKWKNIEINDNKLYAEAVFFEGDDALIKKLKGFVEQGIITKVSIGFEPLEYSEENLLPGQTLATVIKAKLIEASIVDIPANPNASLVENSDPRILYTLSISEETLRRHFPAIKNLSDMELRKELCKKLNLAYERTEEKDLFTAIEKLIKENQNFRDKEIATLVDGAFNERKITAPDKTFYLEIGRKDPETLRKLLSKLPGCKTIESQIKDAVNPNDRSQWTLTDWRKKAPEELRNDPALYQRLLQAENKQ